MALSSQDPVPRLPEAPRRVTRRKAAGRPPLLSVAAIVAAAIEVIDHSGLTGLSMRRVAEQLGTGVASLYAHVSGKDELLELVYDELVGQVPLEKPDPARWREQVRQMMRGLRDILAAHSDAALAGLGRMPTSPQTLAAAESLVAVLKAGGLTDRVIALGLDQLILYVSACAFESSLYAKGRADTEDLERYFTEVHSFYAALPQDRFPVLTAVAPVMFDHGGEERFEFGLDLLIAGMEAASAAERARP
ncbi:MAG TPA: TetR/AcrR family transcriptional regulator [Streptosporangiaceae bacterium]|nr:TetR/AcrR family transcriptional regulator [Streptosporangiaceae bacterium]